jgi:hypothetical protein
MHKIFVFYAAAEGFRLLAFFNITAVISFMLSRDSACGNYFSGRFCVLGAGSNPYFTNRTGATGGAFT